MIQVNGDPLNWVPGMTVAMIIKEKKYLFPMLVVTVNDIHIKPADYSTVVVQDGAIVQIIHLISGG